MQKRTLAVGLLLLAAIPATVSLRAAAPYRLSLQAQRSSPQDLELIGDLPGVAAGQSRFVSYAGLAAMPQVTYTVKDDPDFTQSVRLSGVALDELVSALGFTAGRQLVAAIGSGGYEGHYTTLHRTQHHPFLVLKIDGKEPARWERGPNGEVFAPYFIAYPQFNPVFRILAQPDEPQLPLAVDNLRFYDEATATTALRPPAKAPAAAAQGYRIAMVNCLRCHRGADIGGTKSPFGWPQMALIARGNASAFGKYLVQPNRVNPEASMPPNPEFDDATVSAITVYFQSQSQP